jgi:carbohydrate-selective porin OprB
MPTKANGNEFDPSLRHARGDQVELTFTPAATALGGHAPIVRLLAYVNHARMGVYRDALAEAGGGTPDVAADDKPGRRKRGVGVNVELPLADGGETGGFLRWSGADGDVESFCFTEVERHLSAGVQATGRTWRRSEDRVGLGIAQHGISTAHRDYHAAGGLGFLLGDGALRYGPESLLEGYYRAQLGRWVQVSPDVQLVRDPGYNRDRGPVAVGGLRVNLRY